MEAVEACSHDTNLISFLQEEVAKYEKICEDSFQTARHTPSNKVEHWLDSPWEGDKMWLLKFCIISNAGVYKALVLLNQN